MTELRVDTVESPRKGLAISLYSLVIATGLVAAVVSWPGPGTGSIYEVAAAHTFVAAAEHRLRAAVPTVPAFVVRKKEVFSALEIKRLERTPGVAAVASVTIERLRVAGADNGDVVEVGAVEPLDFRDVAPPAMRDADFVWASLIAGEAVVSHDVAKRLDLRRDRTIRFVGGAEMQVGAFADNGAPNLADVLVSEGALDLGSDEVVHLAVIGAESGAGLSALGDTVERRISGARLERLLPEIRPIARAEQVASAPDVQAAVAAPVAAGLHPVLAESVHGLVSAAGGRVWVVSGYRTSQHQYALWLSALKRYRTPEAARHWVAPPGYSAHERGLAVDLGGDLALAMRLIEELRLPLWPPMGWEPWHFELVGSRG